MPKERLGDWLGQNIARAYSEGVSPGVIAAELGIAPATVRRILRNMGVELRPRRRVTLPEGDVVAQYLAGASTTELGREYSVSAETIRRILVKHDTPIRPAHQAIATTANFQPPVSNEEAAKAVELYKQGLSAAQVANRMGFASKRTVLNMVNAAGVTRPTGAQRLEADLKGPMMQEIAARRRAGESIQALAEEYGLSRSTLSRRLGIMAREG